MTISFRHLPLNTARDEIRLLSILPGQENDVLCGRLFHVPLNGHLTSYHALSYAWKEPLLFLDEPMSSKFSLLIDGKDLKIGHNLAAYLQSARRSNKASLPIWVDAICINQEDTAERSAQVLRMKAIYQNASLVIVWLGPDADFSDTALAFVNMIYERCKKGDTVSFNVNSSNEGSPWRKRMWSKEAKQWIKETLQDGTFTFSWIALLYLFNRSWWYRTWISQEVFLAKEISVVVGTQQLPWKELDSMIWNIVANWTWLLPLLERLNAKIPLDVSLKAARIASIRGLSKDPGRLDLLRIIALTRNNVSTDPRDKIYGVLGIAFDSEILDLHPDYSLSLVDIHKNLLLSVIHKKGHLDYFGIAGSYGEESSLPSWCANLDRQREVWSLNSSFRNYREFFSAAGNTKPVAEFSGHDNFLKLKGFQLDFVKELCVQYFETPDIHNDHSSASMYDGDQVYTALWKTVIGGFDPTNMGSEDRAPREPRDENGVVFLERCYGIEKTFTIDSDKNLPLHRSLIIPAEATHSFDQWYINNRAFMFGNHTLSEWTILQHQKQITKGSQSFPTSLNDQDLQENKEVWNEFSRSWAGVNAFRRVFTTQKGYIGLAPYQLQEGDAVCIFLGGRVPIILRRKMDMEYSAWEFIGECYVHGVMFGELMSGNDGFSLDRQIWEFEIG